MKGEGLAADLLTKAITSKPSWEKFQSFVGLKSVGLDQMASETCDGVGIGLTKIAAAGVGLGLVVKKSLTLAALALGMAKLGRDILRARKPAVEGTKKSATGRRPRAEQEIGQGIRTEPEETRARGFKGTIHS